MIEQTTQQQVDTSDTVTVKILNKHYQVKCPTEQLEDLERCSDYLNEKMQEIKNSNSRLGKESMAITAALNISHELLQYIDVMGNRIRELHSRIEKILGKQG